MFQPPDAVVESVRYVAGPLYLRTVTVASKGGSDVELLCVLNTEDHQQWYRFAMSVAVVREVLGLETKHMSPGAYSLLTSRAGAVPCGVWGEMWGTDINPDVDNLKLPDGRVSPPTVVLRNVTMEAFGKTKIIVSSGPVAATRS